jgi:predicted nucleotidyltransferase
MRLSTDQIQAICQAATTAFGQGTSVWLFGSRVDDAKRGGDIDLLVCPQVRSADDAAGPQQTFMQKIKMLTLLERQLGERQIDIVVEQAQDMRPIVAVAYRGGGGGLAAGLRGAAVAGQKEGGVITGAASCQCLHGAVQ